MNKHLIIRPRPVDGGWDSSTHGYGVLMGPVCCCCCCAVQDELNGEEEENGENGIWWPRLGRDGKRRKRFDGGSIGTNWYLRNQ